MIFLKGCPLRCIWCQNPEAQRSGTQIMLDESKCIGCGVCTKTCTSGAIEVKPDGLLYTDRRKCVECGGCCEICYAGARNAIGSAVETEDLLNVIKSDRVFYRNTNGGVTLSGGEPLAQAEAVAKLIAALKPAGINIAVETSGYAQREDFDRVVGQADSVLFDIKLTDGEKHRKYTGEDNALIHDNLSRVKELGTDLIVRFPLVPGINDDSGNIAATARLAKKAGAKELHILPFHQAGRAKWEGLGLVYELSGTKAPDSEKVLEAKHIAEEEGIAVNIGSGGN